MNIGGILNLNKPAGVTSRDVVNLVQRLVGRKTKVGHAGTLDPLARGVLVVALGPATRLIEYVQQMPKTYQAEFLLGRHSDTEDVDGHVAYLDSPPVPNEEEIRAALPQFTGKILQRPPAYCALKVDGRRAYDLAREGQHVELSPREIVVYRLVLDRYDYPSMGLTIECGSGTYVRSLGRDLAESLGTAAVMSALVRTTIGPFRVDEAVDPDSLTRDTWAHALLPPATAVSHLASLTLDDEAVRRIQNGQMIPRPRDIDPLVDTVAVDRAGRLIGILMGRGEDHLKAKRNFPTQ
jgi:tRNA pseudouridine55 synthase